MLQIKYTPCGNLLKLCSEFAFYVDMLGFWYYPLSIRASSLLCFVEFSFSVNGKVV